MTREEAKRRAELYSALGEGKAIQVQNPVTSKWEYLDINKIVEFKEELNYRIKPEPKYRPFKSQEECWSEMLKHQPFGWVLSDGVYLSIQSVYNNVIYSNEYHQGIDFEDALEELTFIDTTPFGIKEE